MFNYYIEVKPILFDEVKILTIQTDTPEQPKKMITATSDMLQYQGSVREIKENGDIVVNLGNITCSGRTFEKFNIGDHCFAMEHLRLSNDPDSLAYMEYIITSKPMLIGNQNFTKLEFERIDVYIDIYLGETRFVEKYHE